MNFEARCSAATETKPNAPYCYSSGQKESTEKTLKWTQAKAPEKVTVANKVTLPSSKKSIVLSTYFLNITSIAMTNAQATINRIQTLIIPTVRKRNWIPRTTGTNFARTCIVVDTQTGRAIVQVLRRRGTLYTRDPTTHVIWGKFAFWFRMRKCKRVEMGGDLRYWIWKVYRVGREIGFCGRRIPDKVSVLNFGIGSFQRGSRWLSRAQ